ncbi:MAG: response regulator [Chitinivibrionales bacterium]|nr:response regulator [Chitinivibrionales bacterium]
MHYMSDSAVIRIGKACIQDDQPACNNKPSQADLCRVIAEQHRLIQRLQAENESLRQSRRELADNKQLLQILIDHMPDYIFVKDTKSKFILNNRIHLRVLGAQSQQEVAGKSDFDFFSHDLACRYFSDEKIILKYGNSIIDREERSADSWGNEIWLSTTKVPLRDDDGKIFGLVGISRDITHRKKAELERERLEAKIRHHEKLDSLGQLAGGIAHDFNNMLSAIQGFAGLLRKKLLKENPKYSEYAGTILQASKRAADLIQKLLIFSRKSKHQAEVVDIHEEIRDVVKLLEHTIDKRIRIVQNLQAQPATIMGDRVQIQNALLNLAVNARDAMPIGGKLIFETDIEKIKEQELDNHPADLKPGMYLIVKVTDTGTGMDQKIKDRIFEPFFTTKASGKGTGLGLAGVYGTAKSHNGAIEVDSVPGQGTTFKLYLPSTHEKAMPEGLPQAGMVKSRTGSVMLVDDEQYFRDLANEMLSDMGFSVQTCSDGIEALNHYHQHWREIDLVILDMVMPRMNGADCLLKLKDINPDAKVIVATGYVNSQDTAIIRTKQIAGFIQKPFSEAELCELIDRVISSDTLTF